MTLPEYYLYLQQLPQADLKLLQEKYAQQKPAKPATYKRKLIRKSFLPKRKP